MNTRLLARRLVTATGVALAVVVGFGAIRVAAAWTAASAPLVVSPITAATLQARLADEQARSAMLRDQLATLTSQTQDLAAALERAQERIASDTGNAKDLATQLKAAKRRLAVLEAAIAQARRSVPKAAGGMAGTAGSAPSTGGQPSGGGEPEPETEYEGG
jgi:peptidoglycan hydrolase CwlO-like protein